VLEPSRCGAHPAAESVGEPRPGPGSAELELRSTGELLAGYASSLVELRRRGVIRSSNAPAGDYGEWLVARALHGKLAANLAAKSYDLVLPDERRVQVKTRVVSVPPRRGQLQASVFRSFGFDLAALVQLRDIDHEVHRAVLLPVDVVQGLARRIEHVNGWRVMMTPTVLDHPRAQDITDAAQRAARET
jgi:hypothetical protein